jgi:hypothetical protein
MINREIVRTGQLDLHLVNVEIYGRRDFTLTNELKRCDIYIIFLEEFAATSEFYIEKSK